MKKDILMFERKGFLRNQIYNENKVLCVLLKPVCPYTRNWNCSTNHSATKVTLCTIIFVQILYIFLLLVPGL